MHMRAQLIYSGQLGAQSSALIAYLEDVPGVHPIRAGENPATWMLEVTGGASVTGQSRAASVDFAEYYKVPCCFCTTFAPALQPVLFEARCRSCGPSRKAFKPASRVV